MRSALFVGLVFGVLASGLVSCGPTVLCNATTCPDGCCDSKGTCHGPSVATCGLEGTTCSECDTGQICKAGACVKAAAADAGVGGGTAATGGGTAATGGGTTATGGGASTTGGGSATTGGGTAATGGGTTSTGGGAATTGGGSSTGGGSAATGGGTASTGGGTVTGTTWFISPSGDDTTGNGSRTSPWKTLKKATTMVTTTGDLIKVLAGTYTETQTSNLAEGVSLEGEGVTSIIASTLSAQYVPILALQSSAEGTNGNQHVSNLKFDGTNLTTSWAISVAGRSNVSIHDITVIDFQETGVSFSGITNPTGPTEPSTYATGNSFHHNTVTNSSTQDALFGRGNFQFGGQDGMLVHDNVITQPRRTVGSNTNIGWAIKMANEGYIKNCKVFNNTLTRAPFIGNNQAGNWNFAFEMWNVQGLEMYGNTIQGNSDFAGVSKGSSAYGLWFHDNLMQQPTLNQYTEEGLQLETEESDVIVENNHFKNLSIGIVFSPHDYNSDGHGIDIHRITIQKNLFENMALLNNTGQAVIRFDNAGENPVTRVTDFFLINNTFIGGTGSNRIYFGLSGLNYTGSNQNIRIINNIFQNFVASPLAFGAGYMDTNSVITDLTIQNNDFNNNTTNGPTFINFQNQQVVSTTVNYVNSGNITVPPQFVSASDFHLQSTSPLVNAGVDAGLPFTGSAPDIGCFEQ